jgi:elongation factor 4
MASKKTYELDEVGVMAPDQRKVDRLQAGEVGYLAASIKAVADARVGDTITLVNNPAPEPLPGYNEAKPMVFCGLFPTDADQYPDLREALDKLQLSDAALKYEPETSSAMGFGFRCGFLGLLHMEIVQERLERETGLDVVQTAPTVPFELLMNDGSPHVIHSPGELPDPTQWQEIREPKVVTHLIVPTESIGSVMKLCAERRGTFEKQEHLSPTRVMLTWDLPLSEIIFDFYDKLKSSTRGYGTMNYESPRFVAANLVKVRILVSNNEADALSTICHRDVAEKRGRAILRKLQKEIPRHQFEVALQAAVGGKIIARETIRALSKNVTAKCYGGDITRKRKLLAKQKEGKKRMKSIGNVEVPQKAFLAVLQSE